MKFDQMVVALLALLMSLWIFVMYRSEQCAVNVLLGGLLPGGSLTSWRAVVGAAIPLSDDVVYRLPGGLWVFAATVVAARGHVTTPWGVLGLSLGPMTVALGMEFLQKWGVTDGTFDWGDVVVVLLGGWAAHCYIGRSRPAVDVVRESPGQGMLCVASYAVLFLADVHP